MHILLKISIQVMNNLSLTEQFIIWNFWINVSKFLVATS